MRRYTESRTGVPWARTTVRIWGERQIALFEAMCKHTGRRPDELAADIVLDELMAAEPEPKRRKLAAQGRQYRAQAARSPRVRSVAAPAVPSRRHRGLSPANIALTDQILAALDEEGALPISTPALLDKLGLRGHHGTVLRLLNRLARLGEVEKIELEDMRCLYWRRWPPGNTPVPQETEYDLPQLSLAISRAPRGDLGGCAPPQPASYRSPVC
jgi:hypothetical protein